MVWATFLATLSQAILVTLPMTCHVQDNGNEERLVRSPRSAP
jgi:hypothetical protein